MSEDTDLTLTQKLGRLFGINKPKQNDDSTQEADEIQTISTKVERQTTVSQVDVNMEGEGEEGSGEEEEEEEDEEATCCCPGEKVIEVGEFKCKVKKFWRWFFLIIGVITLTFIFFVIVIVAIFDAESRQ